MPRRFYLFHSNPIPAREINCRFFYQYFKFVLLYQLPAILKKHEQYL